MHVRLSTIALGCTLFASMAALAQTPAKPANATGQCKDGTYWTGSTKSGACRGHKGIQTWYADSAGAAKTAPIKPSPTAAPVTTAPAAAPAPAAPPAPAAKPTRTPPQPAANAAPGGGPGVVWVNTSTKVYHCYGDRYYGKTKDGKYMTEADAKAMGAKGARGQTCSK
ncbi:MAG TPA: DUF3761 domain-containing protein [Acidobacteriaceae bacterium]|nr:DUF3761 domain-containing protein [Acidobacteriaceae bacterium]